MRITLHNHVLALQLVNNAKLTKGSMRVGTCESAQWDKHPEIVPKGTDNQAIFESTIPGREVEVLDGNLVERDHHATIYRARIK